MRESDPDKSNVCSSELSPASHTGVTAPPEEDSDRTGMPAPRMPGKHRSSEIHCSRALHVLLKQTEDATFRNACNADEQRGGLVARPGPRTMCWAMLVRSDVVGRGATAGAVLQSQRQLPAMPRAGGRRHGCGPHARARFSHTARAQTTRMRPSITIRSAASAACRPRARGPRARPPRRLVSL